MNIDNILYWLITRGPGIKLLITAGVIFSIFFFFLLVLTLIF